MEDHRQHSRSIKYKDKSMTLVDVVSMGTGTEEWIMQLL